MTHSNQKGNALLGILLAGFAIVAMLGLTIHHERAQDAAIESKASTVDLERVRVAAENLAHMAQDQGADTLVLGATNKIPDVKAFFETSLASKITPTATTFTLVSARDKAGVSLASSTYAFVIDEGTSKEEMVLADCTGTACTNVTRGLSPTTGTTTVAALRQDHGRGASVKITDGPLLLILTRLLQGVDTFDNVLKYSSGITTASLAAGSGSAIPTVDYVNFVGSSGCANASETVRGCVEGATQIETASSTVLGGTGAGLFLQSRYATSSPYTTGLWIPITQNNGKLSQSFLDLTQTFNFGALTTLSSGYISSASSTVVGNFTVTGTASVGALTVNGVSVSSKFGGTGSDGALAVSSGTTTINLASAAYVVKNYSSIAITGTGAIEFSNPHTNGTVIVLKSQGACTLTSSKVMIYGVAVGAAGAAGGTAGNPGTVGNTSNSTGDTQTATQGAFGTNGSNGTGGAGGTALNTKLITTGITPHTLPVLMPGGGAAGGGGSAGQTGGTGGAGGAAIYLECGGAFNFTTGSISVAGANGTAGGSGSQGAGGGGGGGGGVFIASYNSLTANSGSVISTGGSGGAHGTGAGTTNGGGGGGGASMVTSGSTGGSSGSGGDGGAGGNGWSLIQANNDFF